MSTTKKSKKDAPKTLREAAEQIADDEKQAKLPIAARDVAVTREEIELDVKLAETEVEHASAQVISLECEIAVLSREQDSFKKLAAAKGAEITEKRKTIAKLSQEASTHIRKVLTNVRVEHDYLAGVLRYYRLDRCLPDGELYDTVAMPPEEREEAIFKPTSPDRVVLDEGAAEPAGDADEAVNAKGGEA